MNYKLALSFLLLAFSLSGCGYKPSTVYTSEMLGDTITPEVEIDVKNPTEAVFLKDALNEAVFNVFNAKIKQNATSSIKLKVNSTSLDVLDYDKNGYPILYRATATITSYVYDKFHKYHKYIVHGSYDFSIDSNSVVSDNLKHNALKEAFARALQEIEFKVAQEGMNHDN
ncbi:MAG: hypothetical protein GXO40_00625 [Epsilonproteobacteria bacterium]|nr:hypothetical protein [Campylobacterota bacterium]